MSSAQLNDAPTGEFQDNNYISRQGNKHEPLPVQADGDPIEDPIDGDKADTDEQLGKFNLFHPLTCPVTKFNCAHKQSVMTTRLSTRATF